MKLNNTGKKNNNFRVLFSFSNQFNDLNIKIEEINKKKIAVILRSRLRQADRGNLNSTSQALQIEQHHS